MPFQCPQEESAAPFSEPSWACVNAWNCPYHSGLSIFLLGARNLMDLLLRQVFRVLAKCSCNEGGLLTSTPPQAYILAPVC